MSLCWPWGAPLTSASWCLLATDQPMHKTGAIILGVGGDNLARRKDQGAARVGGPAAGIPGMSVGTFYEGVLTAGRTSDAADAAVQADILRAGYGK